jgi:hypothetical protein
MNIYRKDNITGKLEYVTYPRLNYKPLNVIDPKYNYYGMVIEPLNNDYNSFYYYPKEKLTYTNDLFIQHNPQIGTIYKCYELVKHNNETIISNLNSLLGGEIDTKFELWQRNKYLIEKVELLNCEQLTENQQNRLNYINNMFVWLGDCRALRDKYENNILQGGEPEIIWPEKPTKN